MLPRSPAFAIFVAALLYLPCSALGQSSGQGGQAPGLWYRGKWVGYVPAHLKAGNQDDAQPVSPSQAPVNGDPNAEAAALLQGGQHPSGRAARPSPRSPVGRGTPQAQPAPAVVPTSFQQGLPPELDGVVVDEYEPAGCAVPAAQCGNGCYSQACYPGPWVWGRAEYLLWWTDGMNVPPLVTTSPDGTLKEQAGVLGQPDTSILFGNTRLNTDAHSGGRFTLGLWLDPCACRGVEASYMMLGRETERFEASSDGNPILARPFFSIQEGQQDAQLIAFDGVDALENAYLRGGSILVSAKTTFQGAEVLFRRVLYQECENRLDFLLGYQFARLDDELLVEQSFTVEEDPVAVPGTSVELFDLFDASNEFHGAQLGVVFRERVCRWSLEMLMKLGLGNTHSRVTIDGSTLTTVPDADPDTSLGGLLALASNIGVHERDDFAMIPELGVTLGYDITCGLRATFGYTFIYWSKVARPGDQIDLDVNRTQFGDDGANLEGEPRPEFSWVTTDFWAQGLKFGLDYRF